MTQPLDTAAARASVSLFCDSEHRTAQTDELCVIVERACTEIDALRAQLEPLKNGVERCRRGTLAELEALRERLKVAEAVCKAFDYIYRQHPGLLGSPASAEALAAWRALRGKT